MRALVTGCARSGTVFTSQYFNYHGIASTHEKWFNLQEPDWGELHRHWWTIAVSWEAASYLDSFEAAFPTVPVLHQVRHPLATIASLLDYRLFSYGDHRPWQQLIYNTLPEVNDGLPEIDQACLYWLHWNQLCHRPGVIRHRVEDLPTKGLGKNLNTRRPHRKLHWRDVPKVYRADVQALGRFYGYQS